MTWSEVHGLRWANVDLDNRTVVVTRGLHAIRDDGGATLGFRPTKTETSERTFAIGDGLARRGVAFPWACQSSCVCAVDHAEERDQ